MIVQGNYYQLAKKEEEREKRTKIEFERVKELEFTKEIEDITNQAKVQLQKYYANLFQQRNKEKIERAREIMKQNKISLRSGMKTLENMKTQETIATIGLTGFESVLDLKLLEINLNLSPHHPNFKVIRKIIQQYVFEYNKTFPGSKHYEYFMINSPNKENMFAFWILYGFILFLFVDFTKKEIDLTDLFILSNIHAYCSPIFQKKPSPTTTPPSPYPYASPYPPPYPSPYPLSYPSPYPPPYPATPYPYPQYAQPQQGGQEERKFWEKKQMEEEFERKYKEEKEREKEYQLKYEDVKGEKEKKEEDKMQEVSEFHTECNLSAVERIEKTLRSSTRKWKETEHNITSNEYSIMNLIVKKYIASVPVSKLLLLRDSTKYQEQLEELRKKNVLKESEKKFLIRLYVEQNFSIELVVQYEEKEEDEGFLQFLQENIEFYSKDQSVYELQNYNSDYIQLLNDTFENFLKRKRQETKDFKSKYEKRLFVIIEQDEEGRIIEEEKIPFDETDFVLYTTAKDVEEAGEEGDLRYQKQVKQNGEIRYVPDKDKIEKVKNTIVNFLKEMLLQYRRDIEEERKRTKKGKEQELKQVEQEQFEEILSQDTPFLKDPITSLTYSIQDLKNYFGYQYVMKDRIDPLGRPMYDEKGNKLKIKQKNKNIVETLEYYIMKFRSEYKLTSTSIFIKEDFLREIRRRTLHVFYSICEQLLKIYDEADTYISNINKQIESEQYIRQKTKQELRKLETMIGEAKGNKKEQLQRVKESFEHRFKKYLS